MLRKRNGVLKMKISEYDRVLLKDGNEASIVEIFSKEDFLADIDRNNDTDTDMIHISDIKKVIKHFEY